MFDSSTPLFKYRGATMESTDTKPIEVINVLFIGGPLDSEFRKVDPLLESYYPSELELEELDASERLTSEMIILPRQVYRREFLKWGTKYFAVFIYNNIPNEDILRILLLGYRGKPKLSSIELKERPTGRTFDFGL